MYNLIIIYYILVTSLYKLCIALYSNRISNAAIFSFNNIVFIIYIPLAVSLLDSTMILNLIPPSLDVDFVPKNIQMCLILPPQNMTFPEISCSELQTWELYNLKQVSLFN